jgi:pimeloyl-ACP methyl ester carboxylesterase
MRTVARLARALPRSRAPFLLELALDAIAQEPGPSGAVLQGILFGRTAPNHLIRPTIETPALVIGHRRDPIHPFSDADMIAAELPNAKLIDANSIIELRTNPKRLTTEIAQFIDDCWGEERVAGGRRRRSASA